MAKIVQTKRELIITYSWGAVARNHGICGHTYEAIDYYWLLKDHFDTAILLGEDITESEFKLAITTKYDFTDEEVNQILDNTIYHNRPKILSGNMILFTDGGIESINAYTLIFRKVFMFGCGEKEIVDSKFKSRVLLDKRVYDNSENCTHYVKKINFKRLKKLNNVKSQVLLYCTSNCRMISRDEVIKLRDKYKNILVIAFKDNIHLYRDIKGVTVVLPPVNDLVNQFDKYVYTRVPRQFDCSPRFIAECKHYNKEVIYHDITYQDKGLEIRRFDIENNFESLQLNNNDEIINIIKTK